MTTLRPANHVPTPDPRIGVLLVNLGTPDQPEPSAVRRYLKQFLSDRRVVELPALLWQPILRGIILNTRPRKSAAAYREIWMDDGSPLAVFTARQAAALQASLGTSAHVNWAMRYGQPAIADKLGAMQQIGCTRILVVPLYPQYCGATTASVVDETARALAAMRWQPTVRFLPPYYDDPVHIDTLARVTRDQLATLDFTPDVLLASFHGMPERTLTLGDPYHCQCQKTARLLGEKLDRPVMVSFQSRFGRAKWLEPSTAATLTMLGEQQQSVAVIAPGFAADCLETLEELAIRGQESFHAAGGKHFAYLPCLNDSAPGTTMLSALMRRELAGWISSPGGPAG